MKKLKLKMYLFVVCAFLTACSGDNGDPGPEGQSGAMGDKGNQGDKGDKGEDGADASGGYIKQGSFQGTVTGARRDGTAFTETFAFEYRSPGPEIFNNNTDYLERTNGSAEGNESYLGLELKKLEALVTPEFFVFNYEKELNANTLFSISLRAEFEDQSGFVKEIDPAINNADYHFGNGGSQINPSGIYYVKDFLSSDLANRFQFYTMIGIAFFQSDYLTS